MRATMWVLTALAGCMASSTGCLCDRCFNPCSPPVNTCPPGSDPFLGAPAITSPPVITSPAPATVYPGPG